MQLNLREFGTPQDGRPAVILLHGLFGSLVNWQRVARTLSAEHYIIVPDLRNHGRSPHDSDTSYPAMAADLLQLMDELQLPEATLIGHSMGGKLAMWLALTAAPRVSRMISVDIAPATYQGTFGSMLEALIALPLKQLESRQAADAMLAPAIPVKAVRDYLLQNLQHTQHGWRWRNNLAALSAGIRTISTFPQTRDEQYNGPSLFLNGAESDYVLPQHHSKILQLFPNAQLQSVAGAGHWVYAEQPTAFLQIIAEQLNSD